MRTQVIGKEMETISGFFLLDRVFMGSQGDKSPWNDKAACSSVVHVPTSWYPCSINWSFICFLEETNFIRKLEIHVPKINRNRKAAKGPKRGDSQEHQDKTSAWDVSVSLGWGDARIGVHEHIFLKMSIWKPVLPVFPRVWNALFLISTLNSFQRVVKLSSSSRFWFNLCRGRWQVPVSSHRAP